MNELIRVLEETSRSAVIQVMDEGADYKTAEYELYVDGKPCLHSAKTVETLYGLTPDTAYELQIKRDGVLSESVSVRTRRETVTLNVRDFGAHGDGVTDDTAFLQAAILVCPKNSRVYIPGGVYRFTNLFLKSDMTLELGEGAVLSAIPDGDRLPVLPGRVESSDGTSEFMPGTWEGKPVDAYAGLITGLWVENVTICGRGTLDGDADFTNWWNHAYRDRRPARPKAIFLNRCKNVTVTGITVKNSPAWNLHPYFSEGIRFLDLRIQSPADSHNTDGIDPESCRDVEIAGVWFSVGDDCIAIKSGTYSEGRTYGVPCTDIRVHHCLMERGHGGVTVGSEIAAGVDRISVSDCRFIETDRGLRVKTRRGRGKDSCLRGIVFDRVRMEGVRTAFVINAFYFCGPDGKTEYVASKEALPVDDRTPRVGEVEIRNVICTGCHVAGIYFYGLPESKIEKVVMENVRISFAEDPEPGVAAMMTGCEPDAGKGIFIRNAKRVELRNVEMSGYRGEPVDLDGVDEFDWDRA